MPAKRGRRYRCHTLPRRYDDAMYPKYLRREYTDEAKYR